MAHYVLTYNKGFSDCSVERFDTRQAAEKAAAEHEGKEEGLAVTEVGDLKHFSMHELTELYAGLNGTGPSRFRDMDTGASRVLASMKGITAQADAGNTEQPTNGEDGDLPKAAKKKTVKKAAVKSAGTGSRKRFDMSKKIYKLVTENPRRKGTGGFKSWELIRSGMKIEEYISKGGRVQDLKWDIDHKFVELRD